MIAVVGGNSFLAEAMPEQLRIANSGVVYLSRTRPPLVEPREWLETSYHASDGSIDRLVEVGPISCLIWLASPDARGLFVQLGQDEIVEGLSEAILFQTMLAKAVLPGMMARGHGRFVFAGSVGAYLGDVGSLLYTQFKAAQSGLSRGLAIEYGRFGITSSVIQLGYLGGGMSDAVPEPRRIEFIARTSTGNAVTANDFWSLVEAVIRNSSLNGSEINLDGGFR